MIIVDCLKKLPLLTTLSLPFVGFGCQQEMDNYPLNSYSIRSDIPGLHLFDEDESNSLEPEEVEKYFQIVIDNGDTKPDKEEIAKISRTIERIKMLSPSEEKIDEPGTIRPPNIQKTIDSFEQIHSKLLAEYVQEKEKEIKERISKNKDISLKKT